jgi:3-oxoacyl-[acyl-carrier protein] reductase
MTDISERVTDNAQEVADKWHARTYPVLADLTDFAAVGELFKRTYELLGGRLDFVINNANFTIGKPFEEMTEEDIRLSIDGPYTSVVYCCRHACDYLIPQRSGRIINISSESAMRAKNIGISLYAASKAGVMGLTRSLAGELGRYGIIVNGVAPGVMMNSRLRQIFDAPSPETAGPREAVVLSIQDSLTGRVSIPEEVANTVAFLCSDAASYIVGQNIMNGGGQVVI